MQRLRLQRQQLGHALKVRQGDVVGPEKARKRGGAALHRVAHAKTVGHHQEAEQRLVEAVRALPRIGAHVGELDEALEVLRLCWVGRVLLYALEISQRMIHIISQPTGRPVDRQGARPVNQDDSKTSITN